MARECATHPRPILGFTNSRRPRTIAPRRSGDARKGSGWSGADSGAGPSRRDAMGRWERGGMLGILACGMGLGLGLGGLPALGQTLERERDVTVTGPRG